MSSYSEYLGRLKQRLPQYIDTRPHRDAGHQTEVVKRLAAAQTLETTTDVFSGNMMLNAPSTQVNSVYKGGHKVQDASLYQDYVAGQEVAQSSTRANTKASQIQAVCYSSTTVPEINDRLRTDAQLAAVQAAKNVYSRGWNTASCCQVCGEPVQFTTACPCALTTAQQGALKDVKRRFTTPS
jgi:hypothetical protein